MYFSAVVQFIIHENAPAVFADHYFFALADLALFLRGNRIEATAAGITHYRHNCQAIAVAVADTVI